MMNPSTIVQGATDVDYVLAASVFLTFINTTRYLEFFPDFYVLITTVLGGLPSVLRFMVGCTPIYIGFATGNLLFAHTHVLLLSVVCAFQASTDPQNAACVRGVAVHGNLDYSWDDPLRCKISELWLGERKCCHTLLASEWRLNARHLRGAALVQLRRHCGGPIPLDFLLCVHFVCLSLLSANLDPPVVAVVCVLSQL
jgi:hypothetical protein